MSANYAGGGRAVQHRKFLKIEGNWKDAVKKALKVKKPPGGWPKATKG